MPDQENRLDAVLSQLADGHISTADAARLVRTMKFPAKAPRTTHQAQSDASLPEPAIPESGSFFDISRAYAAGRINRRQYEALQEAAGDAIKAASQAPDQQ